MTIGIYKITSPSGRIYIGQSWNIEKRWFKYKSNVPNLRQPILHASFVKHNAKNHSYEIIEELPSTCIQQDLDELEKYYITFYREQGFRMMNCREGGSNGKHSQETREKISRIQKGNRIANSGSFKKGRKVVFTQEHIKNMSRVKLGKKLSEENKRGLSEALKGEKHPNYGKHLSEEARRKIGDVQRGRKHPKERCIKNGLAKIGNKFNVGRILSEEVRRKISNSRKGKYMGSRNPATMVINLKTGMIFKSINSAAKHLGVSHATLKLRLIGRISNDTGLTIYKQDELW